MSEVLSYITDPVATGVYHISFSISLTSLRSLFEEICKYSSYPQEFKLLEEEKCNPRLAAYMAKIAEDDLERALDYLSIISPQEGILSTPKVLPAKGLKAISIKELLYSRENEFSQYFIPWSGGLLTPNLALISTKDAINIRALYAEPNIVLNVISMKESGCKIFETLIRSIPIVGQDAKVSKISQKHSSRYCFEPLASAVILWINTDAHDIVPFDIQDFLKNSITYYEKNEWRIAIILAAIGVESILAEIYEELFHETAPSDPIGAIKVKIHKKQKFPNNVLEDIDVVNQSRISAVHRSSTPVGPKETRNAIVGATKFTHWAYLEGPLSH